MLGYLFAKLWKNPLARYGTFAAVILITFTLIFSSRQGLYVYFSRLFSSPDWSDVVRHGHRPFGFDENESKAIALTQKAWREIYTLARGKIAKDSIEIEPLRAAISKRPYSSFLRPEAERTIFTLFDALHDDCGRLITSLKISDRARPLGDMVYNSTTQGMLANQLTPTMRALLKIHAVHIREALEKKPDYIPAIELSEDIFYATCNLRSPAALVATAIDYREYFIQKQIYLSDHGRLYDKDPELFETKSQESYLRDPELRALQTRYFEATRFRTAYEPAHLKNMRQAYATLKTEKTLAALIAALLAEARNSTPATAQKCHFELFALDYPGISERADYVVALAESAMRGEEFVRATNIIGNALRSGKFQDRRTNTHLARLRFQLDLYRHESENLSRF